MNTGRLKEMARKEFEANLKLANGYSLDRNSNGLYVEVGLQSEWRIFCRGYMAAHESQQATSDQGDAEPVGVIELSDYVQLDDYAPVPRKKALTETSKGSIQNLPVGTKLYTQPPSGVPEGQVMVPREFLTEYHDLVEDSDFTALHKLVRKTAISSLLSTNATPPRPEWVSPHEKLPVHSEPVLGYHPEWIDGANEKGVRECFTTGDGDEWLSAYFPEGGDEYLTNETPPELWHPYPNPPEQGGE